MSNLLTGAISGDNITFSNGATFLLNSLSGNFIIDYYGTEGDDYRAYHLSSYGVNVDGLGGDDQINGSWYSDILVGGAGDDHLYAEEGGDDILLGGQGNDRLMASAGDDYIDGGEGDDILDGGYGKNVLIGGAGNDTIHAARPDNLIDGGEGFDSVFLWKYRNEVTFYERSDGVVEVVSINDPSQVNYIENVESFVFRNETLSYDEVFDRSNTEELFFRFKISGENHDLISNSNTLIKGYDVGLQEENDNVAAILRDSDELRIDVFTPEEQTIEGLVLNTDKVNIFRSYDISRQDLYFYGNQDKTIYMGGRTGRVETGEGNDGVYINSRGQLTDPSSDKFTVYTHGGDDRIILKGYPSFQGVVHAGDGDDIIAVRGIGNHVVYGGDGHDTIDLDGGAYVMNPNGPGDSPLSGNSHIEGGNGDDIITASTGDDIVYGGTGEDTINGNDGHDRLYGNDGHDRLYGNDGHDVINGQLGNDFINGGLGNDIVYGGDGNDTILGGAGIDRLYGGDGDDFLYANGTDEDIDNAGNWLYGEAGNDYLTSGAGTNRLYGGDGNDRIDAREGGINYLYGDDGSDILEAADGNDFLYGGNDNDFLYGGDGSDKLYGGNGDDVLHGEDGRCYDCPPGTGASDTIYGGAGNDTLVGGGGRDYLNGGQGADIFFLDLYSVDRIRDFDQSEGDKINISDLLTDYDSAINDINDFVNIVTRSASRTDIIINEDGLGNDGQYVGIIYGNLTGETVDDLITNGTFIVE